MEKNQDTKNSCSEATDLVRSALAIIRKSRSRLVNGLQGDALMYLGHSLYQDGELVQAFKVYQEARELFFRTNDTTMLERVDGLLDALKRRSTPESVQLRRKIVDDLVESKGKNHHETILHSFLLGKALYDIGKKHLFMLRFPLMNFQ